MDNTLEPKLYMLILFIGMISSCDHVNDNIDYRDKFCGDYNLTIYSFSYLMGDTNLTDNYDTIVIDAQISKFTGFTCNNGQNYLDIDHKIGILYNPDFTFNSTASSCNDILYFTHGFLHPTISDIGILTYPEFTCDFHAEFEGKIENDTLRISYSYHGLGGGWSKELIGKRIN